MEPDPGKKVPTPGATTSATMRETLFGDMPWDAWSAQGDSEPWLSFASAHKAFKEGRTQAAVESLGQVLATDGLESRHYVQAWHFLRGLGVAPPPDVAKYVYGVVIEASLKEGLDLVAAYDDGTARYWNFSGAGIVWDAKGDEAIDGAIQTLLKHGQEVANKIGPWLEPRRPAPPLEFARLNMLTPSGLHFGEAPMKLLAADPLAGGLLQAGVELLRLLTAKGTQRKHGEG